MLKPVFLLVISITTYLLSFGQSSDTIHRRPLQTEDTDDRTFVKAEVMPTLLNGPAALEDTLTRLLRQQHSTFEKGTSLFSLIIDKTGNIDAVSKQGVNNGTTPFEKDVVEALVKTAGMWVPASESGEKVNCYKFIYIEFSKRSLKVTERQ